MFNLTYAKAVVAAAIAGLTALATALVDNGVSAQEWITVAIAILGTGGGTYQVKNAAR